MWAVPARNADAFLNHFTDRVGGGSSTDGLPIYCRCCPHQCDHGDELRETEAAAATGGPAAAVLHEQFGSIFHAVREYSGRPGGAFPDPGARDRYDGFVAAIRGAAAGFGEAGFDRLSVRIGAAAEGLAMCVLYHGLSPTTHRIEKIMRRNKEDGNIRHMLISPPGKKRYSDARACRETWREQGIDPFYEM